MKVGFHGHEKAAAARELLGWVHARPPLPPPKKKRRKESLC